VVWYAQYGHAPDIVEARRAHAPWYRTKTHPSYLDMLVKLRRVLIAARFRVGTTQSPIPEETLDLQLAWADAAA
jgi:hypothetical protein